MSDFESCPHCGEYDFLNSHTCAPLWEVQGPIQTGFGFHLILVTKRTDPTADKAK